MKGILILLPVLILVLASGFAGCSNTQDKAYQRGYEAGYVEGRAQSIEEGRKAGEAAGKAIEAAARDSGYKAGYQAGYSVGSKEGYDKGFAESTRLFGPKDELVKVLSYKLVRDSTEWVTVVGELQNLSNKQLYVEVTGVLLDSSGQIVSSKGYTWNDYLQPQEKTFFNIKGFYKQPDAVDARLAVKWE